LYKFSFTNSRSSGLSSDGFVGVKHHAEGLGTHGGRRQVLVELGTDESTVTVAAVNLAPDGLMAGILGEALGSVDKGDALSMIESSRLAVSAALHSEDGGLFPLGTLSTSEVHESCLLVESK
jgi:hypothetical protein